MSTNTSERDISARISKHLARSVGSRKYSMWFDRSARLDYQNDHKTLEVAVPNQFVAQWIDRHFREDLRAAIEQEVGDSVRLDVRVNAGIFNHNPTPATP